ncbi:MAG: hypothetical protein MZW92_63360 [Comamonadaceae bacterium]|nr:hypothetical protein [Comamonadaceae bacterium]
MLTVDRQCRPFRSATAPAATTARFRDDRIGSDTLATASSRSRRSASGITRTASLAVVDAPTIETPVAADLSLVLGASRIDNGASSTVTATVTAVDSRRNTLPGIPVTFTVDRQRGRHAVRHGDEQRRHRDGPRGHRLRCFFPCHHRNGDQRQDHTIGFAGGLRRDSSAPVTRRLSMPVAATTASSSCW